MPEEQKGQWERTPLGKILRTIGTGERLGTAAIYRPIAEAIDPQVAERLAPLGGDVYAGDVLNALFPPTQQFPSPLEKAGRFLGGAVAGAAVDPLTYLLTAASGGAAGVLTGAGRAAAKAGRLAPTVARQAAAGQRTLLAAKIPGAGAVPLVPRGVSVKAFQAAEVLQRGKGAQTAVQALANKLPVLEAVGLPKVAKFYDDFTTTTAQKFGFNIGADPWLMRTHQELFSKITGHGSLRMGQVVDDLEPMIEEAAKRFATRLDIDPTEAYTKLKSAVTEATDMHPYISVARDAAMDAARFKVVPKHNEFEKARQAIQNNFGTLPTWGGPASPVDTNLIRQVRSIVVHRKRMASNVLAQDEARLGRSLALHTHPDAGYSAGIMSKEAKDWFSTADWKSMRQMLVGGKGKTGRPYHGPPSEHHAFEIARTMRMVDPVALQKFKEMGLLEKFQLFSKRKGTQRWIDPHKFLTKHANQPTNRTVRRLVDELIARKQLTAKQAGELIPSIPTLDKNRYIWENGWGRIPPKTIKKFFNEDPTVIDAARGMASDRAMLSKQWFDAVKKRGTDPSKPWEGRLIRPAEDPQIPADWVEIRGIPELHGQYMAPDEAKFLSRLYEADLNLGPNLRKALQLLHVANTAFKSWTLAPFPAYHTRNYFGLMWNYYLGMDDVVHAAKDLQRSQGAWKAIRGGKASASRWTLRGAKNPTTGKDWTAGEIWREVEKNHGWGVGFVAPEGSPTLDRYIRYVKKWGIDDPERELLRGMKQHWKDTGREGKPFVGPPKPSYAERLKLGLQGESGIVEQGFRIGSYMDDRIRMAHLLGRLRQGDPMMDAIRSTKKHFFDYHQLSPMERTWAREAIPFYGWSRKNIPYQLEMLIKRPDRIARFHGGLQAWEGSEEVPSEEKYLNNWMKKNFSVRIRRNKSGQHEYFAFKNWLPIADIQDIFHGWEWLTQGLTPWARVPIEQMMNLNWFTGRKIDHLNNIIKGERTRFGTGKGVGLSWKGAAVPNRLAHIIKSIRLSSTAHQLLDNPQEMEVVAQIMRTIAGRVYPLDSGRAAYQLRKDLDMLETSMRKSVRSAAFAGDKEATNRLVEEYLRQRKKKLKGRGFTFE